MHRLGDIRGVLVAIILVLGCRESRLLLDPPSTTAGSKEIATDSDPSEVPPFGGFSEVDTDSGVESDVNTSGNVETDTDEDADGDGDSDGDIDTHIQTDTGIRSNIDSDSDTAPERGADTDIDPDTGTDTARDTEIDTGTYMGTDADRDSGSDTDGIGNSDAQPDTGADTSEDGSIADERPPLVTSLSIVKISIFQSVEIPLMADGDMVTSGWTPVVAGKSAILRVYVERQHGWLPREVEARLELSGTLVEEDGILSDIKYIEDDSLDMSVNGTFNFSLNSDQVVSDLAIRVTLYETGEAVLGDAVDATWPPTGTASVNAVSPGGSLNIVLVPIRYDADDSGRLPSIDEDMLDLIREQFGAMYPVTDGGVAISVLDPMPWDNAIEPGGTGWSELLRALADFKASEGGTSTDYFFGIVEPAKSYWRYCKRSCVNGLGYLPFHATDGYAKVAVGLGFQAESAVATMVHEVGHNHGLYHSPCGGVDSPDPNFPYEDGSIGVYGYDAVSETLMAPTEYFDFMGYCYPTWVSDYAYGRMLSWMQDTHAQADIHGRATVWRSLSLSPNGDVALGGTFTLNVNPGGVAMDVVYYDGNGRLLDATVGYLTPHGDLAGGLVLIPEPRTNTVYISLNGGARIPLFSE